MRKSYLFAGIEPAAFELLRSLVVNVIAFQPSHLRSIRAWVSNAWNGSIRNIDTVCSRGKGIARSNLILLENFALKLGLGQRC